MCASAGESLVVHVQAALLVPLIKLRAFFKTFSLVLESQKTEYIPLSNRIFCSWLPRWVFPNTGFRNKLIETFPHCIQSTTPGKNRVQGALNELSLNP